MLRHKDKITWCRVSLIAAMECNLSCDYCVIAHRQEKNNKTRDHSLLKKTIDALKNGEYLENVKAIFKRCDADRNKVNSFEIWGQEPTLILRHFWPKWADWYHAFPEIEKIFFSTNGMAYMDDIVAFAKEVEKWAEHPIKFEVQVSYDGNFGEDSVRRGSQEKIEENMHYLISELNKCKFKNVNFGLFFHGVLSKQLMKKFAESEEFIYNYLQDADNFIYQLEEECTNTKIDIGSFSAPPELNYIYTTDEGENTAEAITKMARIENLYFDENPNSHWCGSHGIFGNIADNLAGMIREEGMDTIDGYIEKFAFKNNSAFSYHTDFCGAILHDLKVTYDGKSVICQNMIPDFNLQVDPLEPSMEEWAIKNMVDNYAITNFLTGTDEELDKTIYWAATLNRNNCYNFYLNTVANFMYLLASAGQISNTYLQDEKKLIRHAFILSVIGVCYYNNMIETGSNIIYSLSLLRNYCNGLMDILEEHINRDLAEHKGRYNECGGGMKE